MSFSGEDSSIPPPSQSHFSQFENFAPKDDASFEDEFARLASSQEWVPGSKQYTRERTIAMRHEIKFHYFSQSHPLDDTEEELTEEEQQLKGYQDLCHEVRIPPSESIPECKKRLKNTLVNIVDLIDARRTCKEVEVWDDFEAFREYTLKDEHRIDMKEAMEDGGYLESLLQHLRHPRRRGKRRGRRNGSSSKVVSGRATKKRSR